MHDSEISVKGVMRMRLGWVEWTAVGYKAWEHCLRGMKMTCLHVVVSQLPAKVPLSF